MIRLTRLNREAITVNSDLIECLESTPDTLIKLTNGETMMVLETVDQVVSKVMEFRRRILCPFMFPERLPCAGMDPAGAWTRLSEPGKE